MKEIEDNKRKWTYMPCSLLEELILLKCQEYLKKSTDLMQSLTKYPWYSHGARTNNLKICMDPQDTPNSKSNLKKEQIWRYHIPWFHIIQQNYINQNSILLAQRNRHVENRESRNKLTHIWSINLWYRSQEYTIGKDNFFNIVWG